jgi:PAS domain S-box-containing protein
MNPRKSTPAGREGGSTRVFIVEDESIVADEIRYVLESEGYSVTGPATSGTQAVRDVGRANPDLVLMDIHLKGKMDGIGAAAQIVEKHSIPVVYLTAYSDSETLDRAKKTNPFGFITKPFSGQELVSTVAMALNKIGYEQRLNRLNTILRTIRNINQLITREKRPDQLVQNACNCLIDTRGYASAWAVLLDERLHPVSAKQAGMGKDFAPFAEALGGRRKPLCIRRALKGKRIQVFHENKTEPACPLFKTCRNPLSMTIRLEYAGIVYGIMGISMSEGFQVDAEESALLEELSEDISFALYGIALDRKQKETEKALDENQRILSTLMSNLPGMAYRSKNDKHWTKDFVSQGCKALTGYPAEDFIGGRKRSYADLIHPEDRERVWKEVQSAVKKRIPFRLVYRIHTASGKWKWVWEQGRGVASPQKGFLLEGFIADISDQKRMEEALAAERDLLHTLMDNIPDSIYFKDKETRFIRINQAKARSLLLDSADEAVGKTDFDFLKKTVAEARYRDEQEILSTGNAVVGKVERNVREDGETWWVSSSKVPIRDASGAITGIVGLSRDITQIKETEDRLRRTASDLQRAIAELERANAELDQFARISSYDLQDSLRTIANYLQLLEWRTGSRLQESEREFIRFALNGAEQLYRQLNDILEYLKLSSRGKPPGPVRLSECLAAVVRQFQSTLEQEGAEVHSTELPTVWADGEQMGHVFHQLLGNALKFRGERVPRVWIRAHEDAREWIISVQDNGIGIEPKFHETIFLIFQRLNARERYPGTGIGLSICKKIVERHGGRIWVESSSGQGSTFSFSIPKSVSAGEQGTPSTAPNGGTPLDDEKSR